MSQTLGLAGVIFGCILFVFLIVLIIIDLIRIRKMDMVMMEEEEGMNTAEMQEYQPLPKSITGLLDK